jgi:acetolactate synthase-1/2/3 large subunit
VLGCGIRRDTGRAYQLHDVDQLAIARPLTKGQFRPERGEDLYPAIRRACRLAREGAPGPVMVEIPANLYLFRHEAGSPDLEPLPPPPAPSTADVERVAELLAKARHPLLYVGLGAQAASAELTALAERLEAPVATTFQGKGVFPEPHPLFLWPGFGEAAPPFVRRIAAERDLTLAIGCRFGEVATGSYGLTPPGPLVHVDIDPRVLGRNFEAAAGVACDSRAFLQALLPKLPARDADADLRGRIREGHAAVRREWREGTGSRVTPALLLEALQDRFGAETIFTSDSGNGTFLAMECLRLERPGRFLAPVDYSCMGYSVPAAIGAKLACPDAPVVALVGDGAFLMTGLEMLTAAHQGIAAAFLVLRDRELAQIAQFQKVAMNRKAQSELPDYDLASICRGLGVECLRLDRDADTKEVLERVAAITVEGRPVVVDVAIDYSRRTHFTNGVVRTNLGRLPWPDRLRFLARAVGRRVTG